MPYKVIHVGDTDDYQIATYNDLNKLFDDGWEICGEPTEVSFRGHTVERYRLHKGPAETGLTAQGPRDVASRTAPGGGVLADGGIGMSNPGAAGQLAQLLAGQASHLGVSQAHNIPGAQVVSGNSHVLLASAGADAAAAGLGAEACPYPEGCDEHALWMDGYRKQSATMEDQ